MSKNFSIISYEINTVNFDKIVNIKKEFTKRKSSSMLLQKNLNEIKTILNEPLNKKKKEKK